MNDPLKTVEQLAACARMDTAFPLDVADRVIPRLRRTRRAPVWPAVTTLACVAAAAVLTVPLLDLFTDPWSACFALFAG
jgi:ferric-dicitrate binding protein FerR (iron transport regulator)